MTSALLQDWSSSEARDRLAALAEKAGLEIMLRYSKEQGGLMYKDDHSPITEADHASHHAIVEGLQDMGTPQLPIVSEESKVPDFDDRRGWEAYWLVDGLDGTREFIRQNGEFTVNIALVQNGRAILGVVHAPDLEVTYWGAEGEGAWRRRVGEDWQRIATRELPQTGPLQVVVSRSHPSEELEAYLTRLPDHETVTRGSSLKFCMIAEGEADLYPRLGDTMEWDTAAAQAVLEAAGGAVRDMDGRPLAYNKENLRNPHFVAAGDPSWFA